MGRIGMALAQRAHFGFNMPSSITRAATIKKQKNASTPALRFGYTVTRVRFRLPDPAVNDETYHLFGAEQFAKMKSSAISLMPDVARWLMKMH